MAAPEPEAGAAAEQADADGPSPEQLALLFEGLTTDRISKLIRLADKIKEEESQTIQALKQIDPNFKGDFVNFKMKEVIYADFVTQVPELPEEFPFFTDRTSGEDCSSRRGGYEGDERSTYEGRETSTAGNTVSVSSRRSNGRQCGDRNQRSVIPRIMSDRRRLFDVTSGAIYHTQYKERDRGFDSGQPDSLGGAESKKGSVFSYGGWREASSQPRPRSG
jgi:hypothetical protein